MSKLVTPPSMYIKAINPFTIVNPTIEDKQDIRLNKYLKPLFKLENYYNGPVSEVSYENTLSTLALKSRDYTFDIPEELQHKTYDCLVYAQNTPNYHSLNSPLAYILNDTSINTKNVFGITHLDNVAGIEALILASHYIKSNTLILMTENVMSRVLPVHGMNLGHATVSLELSSKQGIRIDRITSFTTESDFYEDSSSFMEELIEAYFSFVPNNESVDKIIVQNSLGTFLLADERFEKTDIYIRKQNNMVDFQSSDIWISLQEYLNGKNSNNFRVNMITTNFRHKVCMCSIQL